MPTNDERIARAAAVLAQYRMLTSTPTTEPDNTVLCDLLADLRHYARANGSDYDAADSMSEIHFEEETQHYFGS